MKNKIPTTEEIRSMASDDFRLGHMAYRCELSSDGLKFESRFCEQTDISDAMCLALAACVLVHGCHGPELVVWRIGNVLGPNQASDPLGRSGYVQWFAEGPQVPADAERLMMYLSEDHRRDVMAQFCPGCGRYTGDSQCHCMNDV